MQRLEDFVATRHGDEVAAVVRRLAGILELAFIEFREKEERPPIEACLDPSTPPRAEPVEEAQYSDHRFGRPEPPRVDAEHLGALGLLRHCAPLTYLSATLITTPAAAYPPAAYVANAICEKDASPARDAPIPSVPIERSASAIRAGPIGIALPNAGNGPSPLLDFAHCQARNPLIL